MTSSYWRIVPIDFEPSQGSRHVFLYGELDEIVGPMTTELAEAWIRRFDKPRPADPEATPPRTKIRRSGNSKSAIQQRSSAQKRNEKPELVG